MQISFRQGLISFQPFFLLPSSTPNFVSFNVSSTPTLAAFAHGSSNYLQVFTQSLDPAWGPITGGVTTYLFWDIDLLTAAVTFVSTTLLPVTGLTPPLLPAVDQHWFDLSTTTMKVWDGTKWLNKVRVMAGKVPNGSLALLQQVVAGSQVGLTAPVDAGFIMIDELLRPLRTSVEEFVTTTSPIRIKTTTGTSGVLAVPPNAFIPVRASENIPKFSIVYFSGSDTVGLASSNPGLPSIRTPIGIMQDNLAVNEIGNVTQTGEISWDQWDWSASIGMPLYVGFNGDITPVRPNTLLAYRIGFVKNKTSILFNVDAETQPQIYQANANNIIINGVAPLASVFSLNGLGERVWTISIPPSSATVDGFMSAVQANTLIVHETRITTAEANILNRALLVHTHVISDVIGLQPALTVLTNAITLKADKVIGSTIGHFAGLDGFGNLTDSGFMPTSFALAIHTHVISDVIGLQTALNGKAALVHTHVISDVIGLQAALNLKSNVGHTHIASDITGGTIGQVLTSNGTSGTWSALPTYAITDITGLVSALALKEPTILPGTIAQYWRGDKTWQTLDKIAVGLTNVDNTADVNKPVSGPQQTALNLKADKVVGAVAGNFAGLNAAGNLIDSTYNYLTFATKVHTHVAADITNFAATVEADVAALLVAGANITIVHTPGVITISAAGGTYVPLLVSATTTY